MLQTFNWSEKKLLILGSTPLHSEIVKAAKKLGALVGVVDPVKNSFAKQFADFSFDVDVMDIRQVQKIVSEFGFDGVITGFSDSLMDPYLKLCEEAGLPCTLSPQLIRVSKDKQYFRALCNEVGITTPRRFPISEALSDSFVFRPLIVKPNDNSGARGISICRSKFDLQKAIEEATKNSSSGCVIIEEYLEYEEATLFYLFDDGNAYLSAMGDRHVFDVNQDKRLRLPTGYTFPSQALPIVIQKMDEKFKSMFKKLDVKNGMVFIQGMLSSDKFLPYECGFRLTGSLEYKLIKSANSYNPLYNIINYALTGNMAIKPELVEPKFTKRHFNISCLLAEGLISKISGIDKLEAISDYLGTFLSYYPGQGVRKNDKGKLAQIGARLFFKEDNYSYEQMSRLIKNNFVISDKNGKSLLLNSEIRK